LKLLEEKRLAPAESDDRAGVSKLIGNQSNVYSFVIT
jgi:hypothetical protein